jgi:peptidyl-prolyl cis-trans isomerase SurA
MKKKFTTIPLLFLFTMTFYGQVKNDEILLKIDENPVYRSEFLALFSKNRNKDSEYKKEDLNKDLTLFVDYKLKLIEARETGLDTVKSYLEEVKRYRDQLTLPYLTDDTYNDSLVKQAYGRSLKEVKASHILVKVAGTSKDTVKAYAKISKLRKQILDGADFRAVSSKNSEDPSAKKNGGDLGYFSVFKMVHSFEDAAFSTSKGEVSDIFRSRFGYHILKVHDIRDSKGEVEVAHIMIRDTTANGKSTVDKIYSEINNGGVYEELAKKYSDDRRSATNGGKLKKFGMGAMPKPFDEVSFSLSEENKYSKPFRTAYGWHIVKFLKHYAISSFEDSKKDLMKRVKSDSRSKVLSNPVVVKLKKEYKILTNVEAKEEFNDRTIGARLDSINKWMLVINNDTITQKDYANYIQNRRDKKPLEVYKDFEEKEILDYYKDHLEESNVDFKNIFAEYKNGLLLFDLMKQKIWDYAQNDTLGLIKHYNLNLKDYIKKEQVNALVVTAKDQSQLDSLSSLVSKSDDLKILNESLTEVKGVLIKSGDFEKSAEIFPNDIEFVSGTTKVYKEDGNFILVKIFSISKEEQQDFNDVKGKIMNDYQNVIQKNWLEELRTKHKIKVYKSKLRSTRKLMETYID